MRLPLALLLATAPVAAQQNIVWNLNNSTTGTGNAFPFGSAGLRYQALVSNALLGNTPAWIQDIMVVGLPAQSGLREIIYDDIEIRMGMTPATSLTTAWAANNPNPVTVYRGYLRVVYEANNWRGVGLPASFFYLPTPAAPNLCVEFIAWAIRGYTIPINFFSTPTDASLQRAFLYSWVTTQGAPNIGSGGARFGLLLNGGNWVVVGNGCASAVSTPLAIAGPANKWPTRGALFTVGLSGSVAYRLSYLQLGLSDTTWSGLTLPLDLGLINAPGCWAWNDAVLTFLTNSNGSGDASLPVIIPNQAQFAGLRLFGFWAQLDAQANPFGLTTSDQIKLIFDH